jgi:hypothetical protein
MGFVRTDISEERIAFIFQGKRIADSFYPEEGGDSFLRIGGSYKKDKAPHPIRRHPTKFLVSSLSLSGRWTGNKWIWRGLYHSNPCTDMALPNNWYHSALCSPRF